MATSQIPNDDDLTDSASDRERLLPEEVTIDLPDVSDIPGQEHIHVPPLGDLADTTISSDDEEDILNGDSLDSGIDRAADESNDTVGMP